MNIPENLPFSRSDIVNTPEGYIVGNQLIAAYVVRADQDEIQWEFEGLDSKFVRTKYSEGKKLFAEATALDSDLNPDLSVLVDRPEFEAAWIAAAVESSETDGDFEESGIDDKQAWAKENYPDLCDFHHFDFNFKVAYMTHKALLADGELGNPYYVPMDIYAHGLEVWSIHGEGFQCRWDTSNYGGVWVPEADLIEELDRRAKVYEYGVISKTETEFVAQPESGEAQSFGEWYEAFKYLEAFAGKGEAVSPMEAKRRAALEVCRQQTEAYNALNSGELYVGVVDYFEDCEGRWELVEDDSSESVFYDEDAAEDSVNKECWKAFVNLLSEGDTVTSKGETRVVSGLEGEETPKIMFTSGDPIDFDHRSEAKTVGVNPEGQSYEVHFKVTVTADSFAEAEELARKAELTTELITSKAGVKNRFE